MHCWIHPGNDGENGRQKKRGGTPQQRIDTGALLRRRPTEFICPGAPPSPASSSSLGLSFTVLAQHLSYLFLLLSRMANGLLRSRTFKAFASFYTQSTSLLSMLPSFRLKWIFFFSPKLRNWPWKEELVERKWCNKIKSRKIALPENSGRTREPLLSRWPLWVANQRSSFDSHTVELAIYEICGEWEQGSLWKKSIKTFLCWAVCSPLKKEVNTHTKCVI